MNLGFKRFGASKTGGLLSRMREMLDKHSACLENVEGEDGVTVRKNYKGGLSIGGASIAAGSSYRSYFRVIDASTADPAACKVGVTNGSAAMLDPVGLCGTVKVSGIRCDVDAVSVQLEDEGVFHVWIHSWIDVATGPHAEIVVGAVGISTAPYNPNGGIAHASQLAGRVTVEITEEETRITGITQDYLRGGEHYEEVWGDCEGEIVCPEPEE